MILLIILLWILLVLILILLFLLLLLLFHFHYITFPYCVLNNNYNKQKYLLIYLFIFSHICIFNVLFFNQILYFKLSKMKYKLLEFILTIPLIYRGRGYKWSLQILLLGIIFQRLHHKNAEFGTKNQVLLFLVVSNRKF